MVSLDKIEPLLEYYQRYDNYIATLCIFHEDTHPSLLVFTDSYTCLSCHAHGKTEFLVSKLLNSSFQTKVSVSVESKNPFSRWLKNSSLDVLVRTSYEILQKYPGQDFYLRDRGISQETITRCYLGYRDGYYLFPVRKNSRVISAIARCGSSNNNTRYFVPKDFPKTLYFPLGETDKFLDYLIVCFGIIDAISLVDIGFSYVASTTTGKHVSPSLFDKYRCPIFIFPDKHEEREAQTLAAKLSWRGQVIKCLYDENTKDPNDLLRHNKDKLLNVLKPLGVMGI